MGGGEETEHEEERAVLIHVASCVLIAQESKKYISGFDSRQKDPGHLT